MDNSIKEIDAHGTKKWRLGVNYHRTDGPAVIHPDGRIEWWQNNELHRTHSPAVIYADGHESWWQCGRLHRTDGPAVEWVDGTKRWYLNGYEFDAFEDWCKQLNLSHEEITMLRLQYG